MVNLVRRSAHRSWRAGGGIARSSRCRSQCGHFAWLIVLAGAVHLSLAFYAHRAGSVLWKLLVGLAYIFFGVYLIAHPSLGVVSLTLVLASLFLVEGIFDIALFFQMRTIGGPVGFWLTGLLRWRWA